jgi:hypothetical protein
MDLRKVLLKAAGGAANGVLKSGELSSAWLRVETGAVAANMLPLPRTNPIIKRGCMVVISRLMYAWARLSKEMRNSFLGGGIHLYAWFSSDCP